MEPPALVQETSGENLQPGDTDVSTWSYYCCFKRVSFAMSLVLTDGQGDNDRQQGTEVLPMEPPTLVHDQEQNLQPGDTGMHVCKHVELLQYYC